MNESDGMLAEVQDLTWALLDELAAETDVRRLERLLLGHQEAVRTYVMCVQMHVNLYFMFGQRPQLPAFLQKAIEARPVQAGCCPEPPGQSAAAADQVAAP